MGGSDRSTTLILLASCLVAGCDPASPTSEWGSAFVDHATLGPGFALTGVHAQLPCSFCHDSGTFLPLFDPTGPGDCVACHQVDYQGKHAGTGFPTLCSLCHTPTAWENGTFNHEGISGGFRLLGIHADKACTVCHDAATFQPLFDPADANDCVACHQSDYDGEHTGSGYPTDCSACHTPTAWENGTFNHEGISGGFRLLGIHADKACTVCHDAATFQPLFDPADANDCVACHQSDYDGEHTGSGYPTDCSACHTPTAWENGTFNHEGISGGFRLLGIHADKACTVCHDAATFQPLFDPADANDCVACHQSDYDGEHTGSGYPTDCSACHTPTAWENGTFNHEGISGGFRLLGIHADKACTVCHDAATFQPLFDPADANDCVACHQSDYDGEHTGSGYPTDCSACHTPTAWENGTFNHEGISGGFRLLGIHADKACTVCHDAATFQPLFDPADANDCVACHQSDYDGEHTGSGYPTDCSACHTPTAWENGTFNHEGISGGFRLLGIHADKACTVCHDAATFQPLFDPADANDCVACHQSDYDGEHTGSGYPTDCSACHTPTAWENGTFNHEGISGGFRLLGIHADKACTVCHDAATFQPLFDPADANDCVACHQSDYDGEHTGSGYPTDCSACHTPTAWENGTFNHDAQYFPIFSGTHREKWSGCATCHTDADDFGVFSCFACHVHNQTRMDNEHEGRSGYSYSSAKCLSCHPNGRGD